jgi:hypothetical protein
VHFSYLAAADECLLWGIFAAAHPATQPYKPGLGEFMTATQLRHAKLWFAGKDKNWDLAAYEIDEIKEGLEDAARLHPTFDGVPVAEMIKTIIDPRIERLEEAVEGKNSTQFIAAFDELTNGCNSCHAGASKPFHPFAGQMMPLGSAISADVSKHGGLSSG